MSNTGGRATYKGINAQSWAALSLFLQYIRTSNLDHIAFEQDKLKDFDLVFSDKRKIICESKSLRVTHKIVKEVLNKLIDNRNVGSNDEILLICKDVSEDAQSDIENLRYHDQIFKKKLRRKGFTNKHLALLPRVRFWKVDKKTNQLIATSLFSEIFGVWVPDSTLNELISEILLDKVYNNSESGGVLSRSDFYQSIENRKKQIQTDAGYEGEQEEKLERIDNILSAIKNPTKRAWCNDEISLLTTTPDMYYLAIKKLESQPTLKLEQWDNLWKAASKGVFSLQIFGIFQKNLADSENQEYIINFLPTIIGKLVSFYRQEFFIVDIVKICSAILNQTRTYDEKIFEILESLLELNDKEYFYIKKRGDDKWEQEETVKILKDLFEKTSQEIKQKIIKFILNYFSLVSDDGEYWHYTPTPIFEIIKQHVEGDVESRVLSLSKELSKQYEKFYQRFGRKSIYDGWEHMGFANTDRHFITHILRPILTNYYLTTPEQAWKFITEKLITRKEAQISKNRPDYLNRSVIAVIIEACKNSEYRAEAVGILKDFVEMRKGIPHKTEVVYRYVAGSTLTDEQKWELVKLQLDYKQYRGLPINEHVEKIVSELANKGNLEAVDALESWANNPEYNKYRGLLEGNITSNVPGLLANPQTKTRGIEILKKFLDSEFFINKQGLWDVWETAKVLTHVMVNEFDDGKSIIESIWSSGSLSKNQQVLITSSINGLDKNDALIIRAYKEILSKWLDDCKDDIDEVIKKIADIQSRTSIVQFGEKLAKAREYDGAIRIAKIFINDPDPTLENASDDPEGKHNHHEQIKEGEDVLHITTVRVWVAELLQNFAVLSARDYIPEILPLVQRLTVDPNFYVRAFSCFPLEHLAQQRHTVLPSDGKTRFLDIKVAEDIEEIAYSMLRNKENLKLKQIMRGLLRVFSNFRMVTEDEAKEILQTILNTKDNIVIEEARSLFIFFAEFRATAISKRNEHVFSDERVKELSNFNDSYFKKLLVEILKESSSEIKGGFAWAFWQLPKEPSADFEKCFSLSYKYLSILVEQYEHEVMTDVYYFIEEFIDEKFEECFDLWKKCLAVEKPYLMKSITKDNLYDMHWWPYHYNGKILVKIGQEKGGQEFLAWLDFLLDYPEGVLIANDLSLAVDYLMTLPINDQSQSIFKKVAARNNEHFEKMKEWLKNEVR